MLKISISCTRFETNYSSCTGRSSESIYVAALEVVRKKERHDETQFTPKLLEKLVWVQVKTAGKLVSV
jgi:hypothetical protein